MAAFRARYFRLAQGLISKNIGDRPVEYCRRHFPVIQGTIDFYSSF